MTVVLTIWVSANKLRSLLLSKIECIECYYVLAGISKLIFVGFCVPDLKTSLWYLLILNLGYKVV